MNIEDRSILIDTFEAEAQDHLKSLNEGLLRLEQKPDDLDIIGEMFRSAHSLKGAAKLLGFNQVSEQAHKAEDILSRINKMETSFSSDSADTLFQILDTINSLVRQAVEDTTKCKEEQKDNCDKPSEQNKEENDNQNKSSEPHPVSTDLKEVRVHTSKLDLIGSIASELSTLNRRPEELRLHTKKNLAKFKELERNWKVLKNNLIKNAQLADADMDYNGLMTIVSLFERNYNSLKSDIVKTLKDNKNLAVTESLILKKLEKVAIILRMLPISTIFSLFPRTVRDLSKLLNKKISVTIEGSSIHIDKKILEKIKDPLIHLIRNAVDHGIESPEERVKLGKPEEGNIKITASSSGDSVLIEVVDDGAGIDIDTLREKATQKGYGYEDSITDEELMNIIFEPGMSTSKIITDISGRGIGMDCVKKNIAEIKGSIKIKSERNKGTTFIITVPLTMTMSRILHIKAAGKSFAFSVDDIEGIVEAKKNQIKSAEGKKVLMIRDKSVPLISLRSVFGYPEKSTDPDKDVQTIVLLAYNDMNVGCIVDEILTERDVVIKSFGKYLSNLPFFAGAAPLSDQDGALVLRTHDFFSQSISLPTSGPVSSMKEIESEKKQTSILLVEDSLTTRELEKSILESCGYKVNVAVDGVEGLKKAEEGGIDIIITDVEMPKMNGFQMIQRLRANKELKGLPVIMVTSLEDEHEKKKGMQVGADAYIVKASFDQTNLINTIENLTR